MNTNAKQIDELTKRLHSGSISAFEQLNHLQMVIINIRIAVAKLGDHPEARALNKTGEIISEALKKLEDSTMSVKELAKEIARLNMEGINGDEVD